jgi:predicted protein tyrosine phosphatase
MTEYNILNRGRNMKLLFVCNQNRNRSKTAEAVFKDRFETRSAGLYNENPLTAQNLSWADVIVVMEEAQRGEIARRFPKLYMQKRIISLDIPDAYRHGQQELIDILTARMELSRPFLKL